MLFVCFVWGCDRFKDFFSKNKFGNEVNIDSVSENSLDRLYFAKYAEPCGRSVLEISKLINKLYIGNVMQFIVFSFNLERDP
ncbi:hypothetical protein LEP1GSC172_0773 [Leptospira noguchii]|uniref:Lipoprotein n=1 Tax=Leptospira noguchii TaxID=28182 RepID=M6V3P9_9LEPT|nr:hypothetical protein LEP1GSC172_0773 [Leptospira noguchii]